MLPGQDHTGRRHNVFHSYKKAGGLFGEYPYRGPNELHPPTFLTYPHLEIGCPERLNQHSTCSETCVTYKYILDLKKKNVWRKYFQGHSVKSVQAHAKLDAFVSYSFYVLSFHSVNDHGSPQLLISCNTKQYLILKNQVCYSLFPSSLIF